MNPTMYRYTNIIRNSFSSQASVNQISGFWDVRIHFEGFFLSMQQHEFMRFLLQFMENDFLDGVYLEQWYNEGNEPGNFSCPGYPDHRGNQCLH